MIRTRVVRRNRPRLLHSVAAAVVEQIDAPDRFFAEVGEELVAPAFL
jgi:hypothetical protein